jgi:hypothetical protein
MVEVQKDTDHDILTLVLVVELGDAAARHGDKGILMVVVVLHARSLLVFEAMAY